jgi:hypothetical protein
VVFGVRPRHLHAYSSSWLPLIHVCSVKFSLFTSCLLFHGFYIYSKFAFLVSIFLLRFC